MKNAWLVVIAIVLLVAAIIAVAESTKAIDNSSEASGSSPVFDTVGARTLNVQVCGVAFTGEVLVKQGAASVALVTTKTLPFTGLDDCTGYYSLVPSTNTQITFTRSAGALTVYLEILR